jgi:hypothetical protein
MRMKQPHKAISMRFNPLRRATSRAFGYALAITLAAALSGCGDADDGRNQDRRSVSSEASPHTVKWLEVSSPISPAQWLASRDADRPKPLSDPEVQRIAAVLTAAHSRYRESERMIANRSAQLSDMLKPLGIEESASDILDDLAAVSGELNQTEGFGAISQHYFNLRAAGTSRGDSLATLKDRYGSKS